MNRFCYYLIALLTATSCNQVDSSKLEFQQWAQKGIIIDKVDCKIDPTQNYCLYLPSSYNINKNYPVVYAFDPHGNGRIPVALMKNSAEKFGYVLVGSNNSRNGLSINEINYITKTLISDTKQKIAIDSTRIYLSGFSGGARAACTIAPTIKGIKGVIACSAGFKPESKPLGIFYIGIAGSQDMNYLEIKQSFDILSNSNEPSQLLIFNGKHQWPPESTISEAIALLELNNMRINPTQSNKSIIDEYLSRNTDLIKSLAKSNTPDSLAKAFSILKRTTEILNGLANTDILNQQLSDIKQNNLLVKYHKEAESLEKYESEKQQEFIAAYESKSDDWWRNEIQKLIEGKKSQNILQSNTSTRLLGYISLSCYSYAYSNLYYHNWEAAKHYISIYQQADPENPDCWYAKACLAANLGKNNDAITALKTAVQFGFNNLSKLQSDPLLISLHSLPEFVKIANKQ